jgi:hypothetical protein
VRRTACYRVEWSQVKEIRPYHIQVDVEALKTPAFDWERWLRDHVIAKMPGSSK